MTDKTTEALKLALETAEAIAAANWKTWEELATPEEFERWAKSRANHMAAAIREVLAEQAMDELQAVGQEIQPEYYTEPVLTGLKITTVNDKSEFEPVYSQHKCNPHPDAPHGFDRNASHNADRYVCECEGWEPDEPVQRPQNCGTGYCSCIECPYEPVSIPDHITCPFCESDHVPDWLHDLKVDAKAIRAEALEQAAAMGEESIRIWGDEDGRMIEVVSAIRRLK